MTTAEFVFEARPHKSRLFSQSEGNEKRFAERFSTTTSSLSPNCFIRTPSLYCPGWTSEKVSHGTCTCASWTTRKLQCRARDQALDSFGGCRRRPFERGQLARFAKRIQLVVTARLRVRHQCRAVSSSRCCAGRLPLRLGSRARRKGLCRRRALCVLGTGDRGLLCGAKSAERACGGGGAATNSFDSVHSSTGPCSTSAAPCRGAASFGGRFSALLPHISVRAATKISAV